MQVTKIDGQVGLNFQANVVIPSDIVASDIHKKLLGIGKKLKLPGFRPGKVPLTKLTTMYGASAKQDVMQDLISKGVDKAVKELKLNIAGQPQINITSNIDDISNSGFEFEIKGEYIPEILMPDFKTINIERPKLKIAEEDIQEKIATLSELAKSYDTEKTSKAKMGDQVVINAIGSTDGKEFAGGKLTEHKLVLGSKTFIDNFEEQLVGSKKGDKLTVNVKFPEEYHAKELAGKPAKFEVEIIGIFEPSKPNIDDNFAEKFGCKTLTELKEKVSQNIENEYKEQLHVLMKMHLFNQLDKMLTFDIPSILKDKEFDNLKKQSEYISTQDESLKDKSPQELEDYYKRLSIRRVKIGLLLSEYVADKKLQITENDIRNAIIAQARSFPGQEKAIFDYYQKDRRAVESLRGPILEEKAVTEMFNTEINIIEKEYSKSDLDALLAKENEGEIVF